MKTWTDAVVNNGAQSDQAKSARNRLITDLENAGFSAKDATTYVDGLQKKIDAMHGKTVTAGVNATGSGGLTVTATGVANKTLSLIREGYAFGGKIFQGTTPTADNVLAWVSKDETVVSAADSKILAPAFSALGIPGYAAGGRIGDLAPWTGTQESDIVGGWAGSWAQATINAQIAAWAKAAAFNPNLGAGGITPSGPLQAYARKLVDARWGDSQWPPFADVVARESGWQVNATNPSSGAYGIPQALPAGKMASAGADWATNGYTQLRWMVAYIASRWGTPAGADANEIANHWYAKGGLIPGYASGGTVASQGAAYLKAWQGKHGGGFGAAWGPIVVNEQIAEMAAALAKNTTLSKASLPAALHKKYVAIAADEKARLATLNRELTTERGWRTQLGASDVTLASWIKAAGSSKALAPSVKKWKAEESWNAWTIGNISKMLGYSDAERAKLAAAAHAAAIAGGAGITRTFGGDATDTTGEFLKAALSPFSGGGLVADRGTTLAPGWNARFNGLGRPEPLVPAGGGGAATVNVHFHGPVGSQAELEQWLMKGINKAAQHGKLAWALNRSPSAITLRR